MEGDFRLGDWLIQPQLNRVVGSGREVTLEPKAMDVLVHLVDRAGEVLHKERLIQGVWSDTFVTDDVLIHAVSELRKAFDDDAKNPRFIQTIAKKGYCLIAPVTKPQPEEVARYQVLKKLGQGGMGEVLLAQDSLLRRKVALKFLLEERQLDRTSKKRLLREARAAAGLDHPFICHIHDVGELDEKPFIAMEYIEGKTLKEKLVRGHLTLPDAIRTTSEIAEALEKAHQNGIVHRDMKPANVKITAEGHVKVMDFGLAKRLFRPDGDDQETSGTLGGGTTTPGTIAYMSPEQASNREVGPQSDIFSLGVILYEMVTGVHPFQKASPMETASAVLSEDPPPLSQHVDDVPSLLQHTVDKMLAKDPNRRYQLIHEVHTDLETVSRQLSEPGLRSTHADTGMERLFSRPRKTVVLWALGLVVSAMILSGALVWFLKPTSAPVSETVAFRSTIELPEGERLAHFYRTGMDFSPDGTHLAFVSGIATDHFTGIQNRIYLKRLDQLREAQPIAGTENARQPFFSPDGKWLGYYHIDPSRLMKVELPGGDPMELCESGWIHGASWGPDDTIIFAKQGGGLLRVPASGGEPEEITQLNEAAGEISHRLPHFLPDGESVLFTVLRDNPYRWDRAQVFVKSLDSDDQKHLLDRASDARYVPTGHLVFARKGKLIAVPFDLKRLRVTGPEVPVLENVVHSIYTGGGLMETGAAQFSFSRSGMLAYAAGSVFPERTTTPVWVNRQGHEEEPLDVKLEPRLYSMARISPDGRYVLLSVTYPPRRVSLFDRELRTLVPQTFDDNQYLYGAVWGPGEDYFTFDSDRGGEQAFYIKKILTGPNGHLDKLQPAQGMLRAGSWSPDGQHLAYYAGSSGFSILSREDSVESFYQTRSGFEEGQSEFSPDGKWIVYTSYETDERQVFVKPYPGPGDPIQISTAGGSSPAWSHDGKEIFYFSGKGLGFWEPHEGPKEFLSVRIDVDGDELTHSKPFKLFVVDKGRYHTRGFLRTYDVAPDERFLMIKSGSESEVVEAIYPKRIQIVQNWFEELKRLVPTDN